MTGPRTVTEPQSWFTLAEAARYTRKSETTLRRAVRSRRLRSSREGGGGKLHFHRDWLDAHMLDPNAKIAADPQAATA